MATTSPVVETVSRKRVIPPAELARENGNSMPDCWDYLEALKPEQWSDHIAYLYRDEPKASTYPGAPPAYLDKFVGSVEVRPGYSVQMDDAGAVQQAIKDKFGGRVFRLIVKKGKERITECRFTNEAPPKYPDTNHQQQYTNPLPSSPQQTSDANAIASKAIDTVANQPQEVMNIAINALRASAELIAKSATPPPVSAPSSQDEFDRALKQAMIARLLAPPPDPIELLIKLKQIEGPSGNSNALVDKLLNTAVDRFMNPVVPVASGKTTLLDLGREVLPTIASTARDAVHEWRLGVEAQVRGVELARGMNPTPGVPPVAPAVPQNVAATPSAAPVVDSASTTAPSGEPPFDWLAIKIVEILREPDYTIDQAVDETLSFLYRSHTPIVALLLDPPKLNPSLAAGEQGLLMLFQHHPVLKQIQVNPRLVEFIKKFIAQAKEAEAERMGTAAAPGTVSTPTQAQGAAPTA